MNSILEELRKRNEDAIYIKPLNLAARTLVFSTETFFDKSFFKPNKKFFDVQKLASVREQIGKEVTSVHNGIVYKYEIRKMHRKKTIPLGELRSSVKAKFQQSLPFDEMKHFYKILPWVKDDINGIYIRPLNGEAESLVDVRHSLTDAKRREYYKPNRKYFDLQTNAKDKKQIREEFSAKLDGVLFKFSVGIITNRGLVVQNEDIYRAETEFINSWKNADRSQEIKVLLEGPVPESVVYSAKQLVSDVVKSTNYVNEIVSVYQQHFGMKTEVFMSHLLDLVVFIEPKLSFIGRETIFSRRMRADEPFYKPAILPFLTPAEKLEEIYCDPKLPDNTLDYVNNHMVKKKSAMKDSWIQAVIMTQNLGIKRDRKKVAPQAKSKPKIVDLPPWKSVCKNASDVSNEPDENLLFYCEDVDIYGFTIEQMFKIIETTGVNPYTKNPFPHDYVQRFLDTFHPVRSDRPAVAVAAKSEDKGAPPRNMLAELLDGQLALLEKVCFVCRRGPTLKELDLYNGEDSLCFCSRECFKKYRPHPTDTAFDAQDPDNSVSMFF